jgi:hypothetical protein
MQALCHLCCLNSETGAITAQFHVMFDDWVVTGTSMENELPDLNLDEWKQMFGESAYQHLLDDDANDRNSWTQTLDLWS